MTDATYDASAIRILSDAQVVDAFDWAKAGALASEFSQPLEFVERGLEACRRAGAPLKYFVERYLRGDRTVPMRADVAEALREIQEEQRLAAWAPEKKAGSR